MRKVMTVSLNGNAFQLEDDAYASLAAYLDDANRALASNPDRSEIIADLEQAIADKCSKYLSPHKGVLTRSEIEQVILEMGPVEAPHESGAPGHGQGSPSGSADPAGAPRRLYQISEGALVSGICNGYAAYSGIDVNWIRVIFVLLILVTGGAALIAYLVLMFIIPYASTSEEHAAAHGLPFNARLLVENAKRHYSQLTTGAEWQQEKESMRAEWRRARASWRQERRRARKEWRNFHHYARFGGIPPTPPAAGAPPPSTPYMAHVMSGSVMAILGLLRALLGIFMILAIFSLVNTDEIFGWPLPLDIPMWAGLLGLIIIWNFLATPLRLARRAAYWYSGGYHGPWFAAFDGIVVCAIFIGLAWWGLHHAPQIRDFFENLPRLWENHSRWSNTAARLVVRTCMAMKDWLLSLSQSA